MKYDNIMKAKFISRPNRFIANIIVNGKEEVCHVKNTGRCKELLPEGAEIYVQSVQNTSRRTKYDLISVIKGNRLINMDSQIPNKVFREYAEKGLFVNNINYIKPECKFGNSRIDFYIEAGQRKIFVEVKGCTLEENGVVKFPDAPTERGVKHINELIGAKKQGFESYIVFIIQMKNVKYFIPNYATHREFGEALKNAEKEGVNILAIDCFVSEDEIIAENQVSVFLDEVNIGD